MSRLWIMVLVLLWIPVMAIAQLPGNAQCPVNCSCFFSQWFVRCSNASLSSLPPGIPNATVELDLQHNQFSTLSAGFFPELAEISIIYLGSSGIHQVEPGAFQGVKNLYHLHLDNNLLEQVPEGVFENLTNLIFLHLEHNQIAHLLPGISGWIGQAPSTTKSQLTEQPALPAPRLFSSNPCPSRRSPEVPTLLRGWGPELPPTGPACRGFSSLKQLSVLDLSNNLLLELSDQALHGLPRLRQLYLSANHITNVSSKALPGSLRALSLDENQLTSVPAAIRTSPMLSTLQLSGNPIRKLTSLSFGRRLRSLRQLFLDGLALEQITNLAFTRLRWLELLSLRNNSLESLPPLSSLKSLSTLYLTGNKWRCDCNLIWLRTWQKKVLRKERSPVECSSPEVLQGQLLVDIETSQNNLPPLSGIGVQDGWAVPSQKPLLVSGEELSLLVLHPGRKETEDLILSHVRFFFFHLAQLQKLTCPPFGMDSTTLSPSENMNTPMAIAPPRDIPLPGAATTATTTTSTALITTKRLPTSTTRSATSLHHGLERWDPCLADHISSVHIRTKGNTSLVVSWAFSGDQDQFEVRYTAGRDEQVLWVVGGLAEVTLHDLHAGTEYRVCVIPQNENLLECQAPAARQCKAERTAGLPSDTQPLHSPLGHSHSAVGFGIAVALLALAALALAVTYRLRTQPIQFQRYYDEDGSPLHRRSSNQAKMTMGPVDESMEDEDRHSYGTAASQHPEEKVDCTVSAPPSLTLTSTPKAVCTPPFRPLGIGLAHTFHSHSGTAFEPLPDSMPLLIALDLP
ncbi:leucine-rich repeat-containing protein let-4-like [Gopherus flavomarginatus]|uniref:leucine-rich repeat-containing protein let-4-like n=1 Tax=Gopherus flavomarginatus TaxID=286002 RepID=UPI0021CC2080|nr:leucine-rich repeat-containing protein let-4-like [Gopherus flavomarginatus]